MNLIDPLEARIAPATLLSPTTVTYQDVDGDNVTVKFSKPVLIAADVNQVFHWNVGLTNGTKALPENTSEQQLRTIDLNAIAAQAGIGGVSITIIAKKDPLNGGDGSASVGFIHAAGIDLGRVTVPGDFGHLIAGSGAAKKQAVVSLAVGSMVGVGIQGAAAASFKTLITGNLGSLKVKRAVAYDYVIATGAIGSVSIGGTPGADFLNYPSVLPDGGSIRSGGTMGNVSVGGSVGGREDGSGRIESGGLTTSATRPRCGITRSSLSARTTAQTWARAAPDRSAVRRPRFTKEARARRSSPGGLD